MRVLFTALPATGHFNSIVPLAQAVAAAGHDVGICSSAAFAAETAALGFRHFAGGAANLASLTTDAPPISDPARGSFVQVQVFGGRAPRRLIPDLVAAIAAWKPQILVRESSEYAALLVAEQLGLPHASVATGAWSARDDRRAVFAAALSQLRAEMGLTPDPGAEAMYRYLHLSFSPPRWDGDAVIPATTHFIRYANPALPGQTRPAWLSADRARPLVLASLGTLMYGVPGLFEAIIDGLAGEPLDAIVAIGRDTDLARFGEPPANVRLERYVPQIPILAECAAFVTHGGFNSTKEALSLGVPLVVIPIGGDQPYTAERCAALSLGRVVSVAQRDHTHIREATREVLTDPGYRANAQRFAADMRALPSIEYAVELLVRLATNHRPISRTA